MLVVSGDPGIQHPAVGAQLVGGWSQRSLRLGDEPPARSQDAVWLQAGSYFGDVRVADDGSVEGSMAFTGVSSVASGRIRFSHDLDLSELSASIDDESELEVFDDMLIERGAIDLGDEVLTFEEIWDRISAPGPYSVFDGRNEAGDLEARVVRVGTVATVHTDSRPAGGSYSASRWSAEHNIWTVDVAIGDVTIAPTTPDQATHAAPTLAWTLVESSDH